MAELPLYKDPSLPVERRVADLLKRMTLEEKVAQISRVYYEELDFLGERADFIGADGDLDATLAAKRLARGICGIGRLSLKRSPRRSAELANALQRYLMEKTRLGIPALINEEALHGLMAQGSTMFPQAIALASAWNPELLGRIASAAALEARTRGCNQVFSPVLDLCRDPRWGRSEETYGEDPHLVSRLGVAVIRGFQGSGPAIDKKHVLATAKHFAVHGQPEAGTNGAPGNISERVIRELFLPSFQAAVTEAKVGCVMASYNEIDGVPSHVNPWLLRRVLRDEWGFEGFVSSDGGAVDQLVNVHRVAVDKAEAAARALEAGVDADIGSSFTRLFGECEAGRVDLEFVDEAVARVLRAKFRLGLFDDPYGDPEEAERVCNCVEHRALALEAARQSAILLKNDGAFLPLDRKRISTIAVIGPNAHELHMGGYSWDPGRGVTILDGIRAAAGSRIRVTHAEGCRIVESTSDWRAWFEDVVTPADPVADEARIAEALRLAAEADVVVLVLGENEAVCREGWWTSHLGDRDTLDLPGRQNDLVRAVAETGKPFVILLVNGRPLSIGEAAKRASAVIELWYPGQEGGTAAGEILFGVVNPGGKLPVTIPRNVGQIPAAYNHKPSARRGYVLGDSSPLYPFGFGLSYSLFEYSGLSVAPRRIRPGEEVRVEVDVKNVGARAGDEVVQLYLRDSVSSVTRPVKELKAFSRIRLEPGESRRVGFTLRPEDLEFYGMTMTKIVEPGVFEVMLGGDSVNGLSDVFEVKDRRR